MPETVQAGNDLFLNHGLFNVRLAGDALAELVQGKGSFTAAPLLGVGAAPAVNGDVPGQPAQVGGKPRRFPGRDAVPRGQVCIVQLSSESCRLARML